MPKLLTFLPCRNVLMDLSSSEPSAIGILDEINPDGTPNQDNENLAGYKYVIFPISVLAIWTNDVVDPEMLFEQQVVLITPDDARRNITPVVEFNFPTRTHVVVTETNMLVLRMHGEYRLELVNRRKGDADWQLAASYPIRVTENVKGRRAPRAEVDG